jgi:hypothetical protein
VNYALRGIDDDTPTIGSEEATQWLQTLNRKKNELFENVNVLFDATWEVKSLGAISATATPTFNCDTTLIAPSDEVYAIDSNSKRVYYDIIKPRERPRNGRAFYLSGMNPQVLTCTNEIQSDEDIVGGTLYLPGYYMPADVDTADEDDVIPLPDPFWGVMATASDIAFSDITYEDKQEILQTQANNLYGQMVRKNRRGTYGNPKKTPHRGYRIRNTEVR